MNSARRSREHACAPASRGRQHGSASPHQIRTTRSPPMQSTIIREAAALRAARPLAAKPGRSARGRAPLAPQRIRRDQHGGARYRRDRATSGHAEQGWWPGTAPSAHARPRHSAYMGMVARDRATSSRHRTHGPEQPRHPPPPRHVGLPPPRPSTSGIGGGRAVGGVDAVATITRQPAALAETRDLARSFVGSCSVLPRLQPSAAAIVSRSCPLSRSASPARGPACGWPRGRRRHPAAARAGSA